MNLRLVKLGPVPNELKSNEGDGCGNMQLNIICYFKKEEGTQKYGSTEKSN